MKEKIILIIDEYGFSKVCSAIIAFEGYNAETATNVDSLVPRLNNNEFGLIITSYPYGAFFFEEIKRRNVPTIILSDHIDRELITILEGFDSSYCMIKPLDYRKFRSLVKEVMSGELTAQGGYKVV